MDGEQLVIGSPEAKVKNTRSQVLLTLGLVFLKKDCISIANNLSLHLKKSPGAVHCTGIFCKNNYILPFTAKPLYKQL